MAHINDTPSTPSQFIGAIDQGTTSSRFIIFNKLGEIVASSQLELCQLYPQPGWHEQDPEGLLSSVEKCINAAVKEFEIEGHSRSQIQTIGITNQRETVVVWDKTTGKALYNAIVWSDTRTQDIVRQLRSRPDLHEVGAKCGVGLSTYPSASKLIWLLDNVPAVREASERGDLAFGTVDAWLTYKLNGGPARNVHVTDPSNASRTMLMNLETRDYDDSLLDWFDIDRTRVTLPKIVRSAEAEAYGSLTFTHLAGTRITGCLGDQSAALVGQKGFEAGHAKNTYGTGCFLLYNVGSTPVVSSNGLMSTVAFDFGPGKVMYALEGGIAVAGSSVKFLVNNFGFIDSSSKLCALAETVADNGGCTFVTAFSGLFAPYWIDDARGTMFGLTAFTQKGHVARATLEAVCFQTRAILASMESDSGHEMTELSVDGGMSGSDLIMQTQADIIGIPVTRPAMQETTALGAAIAAGMAIEMWHELEELNDVNNESRTEFRPQISCKQAADRYKIWDKAVQMCRGWCS